MRVVVDGRYGIDDIDSSSHEITISTKEDNNDNKVYLTYQSSDVVLDKDFVCSYVLTERLSFLKTDVFQQTDLGRFESPLHWRSSAMDQVLSRAPSYKSSGVERLVEKSISRRQTVSRLELTPPNGAAYHDVFFKEHGTNPFIDTEDDNLFYLCYGYRFCIFCSDASPFCAMAICHNQSLCGLRNSSMRLITTIRLQRKEHLLFTLRAHLRNLEMANGFN